MAGNADARCTFFKGLLFVVALALYFWEGAGEVLTVDPSLAASNDHPVSCFSSLSEALLSAGPGDTILLGPGRYDLALERFPITIDKPVTIRSVGGPEKTVFLGPRREEAFIVTAPGVDISGITIQHMGIGIVVMADDVRITDSRIELLPSLLGVFTCGVWLVGARHAHIAGNEFYDCGLAIAGPQPSAADGEEPSLTGIFLVGHDERWFTTHLIEDNLVNGRPLIYLVDSTGGTVPEAAGQVIVAGCSDIMISGLEISRASIGVQIAHSRAVRVTNCKLTKNSLFGLYIVYSNGCRVSGVQAFDNNHGIDLRASAGAVVSGCALVANEQGVFLSYTEDRLLSSCEVSENGVGVFSGGSTGDMFFCNRIVGNRHGVLAEGGDGLQIIENRIEKNEISGVRLSPGCRNAIIMGNRFGENGTNALLAGASRALLCGNEIADARLTGVYLWDSVGIGVLGNRFSGNAVDLEAVGTTQGVVLRLNRFVGDGVSVRNEGATEVDARFNWWGTDDTEGVSVEGEVDFTPILPEEGKGLPGGR